LRRQNMIVARLLGRDSEDELLLRRRRRKRSLPLIRSIERFYTAFPG
jgi:hypothetical protein